MKAKKETTSQSRQRKAASRRKTNGHLAPKKPRAKKKLEEMTAEEITLLAWERTYAKRDKFISMWD